MAGDWMKIELELPDKPEVHAMASMLCIDPDCVVGKLIRVWQWFDKHTTDGNANGVTYLLPDRISGVSGFGEAMSSVGWLEQHDKTLCMPKFDRHTSESAKARALTAKRVANHKAKTNAVANGESVTSSVSEALPKEEKRREEVNITEANASGGEPPKPLSPDEIIFGYGLPLLTNAGTAEKQARSFLGGLRKAHGDTALIDKLRDCIKAKPMQPLEWLAAAMPPKGYSSAKAPAREDFSTKDYGQGGRL